ncbi:MAG: AI-2E family transporter [Lachnospiraceae bacterium]
MKNQQEEELENQKANWNFKPYLAVALLVFLVFCLCMSVFFLFYRYQSFRDVIQTVFGVLQPIIIGLAIAYLINPIMKAYEKGICYLFRNMQDQKKAKKSARTIAILGAVLTFIFIICMLFGMMIPELLKSIRGLIVALPDQFKGLVNWINHMGKSDNEIVLQIRQWLIHGTDNLQNWLKQDILPQAQVYLTSITSGIISMMRVVLNFIIGIIVSIYVLADKEKFVGMTKKTVYAFFPISAGNAIVKTFRKSNEIFGGFISGKLLDSAIIGVLCYVSLLVLDMPYALLVSVIVGVTNIIPFFGPYIGAIPSALLITLANPMKGVYFVIFIIILQQIDGNIIGPKILGNSTGLSSFWVVFAIMLGGGLFGVVGMILGVPVFAVIYYIAQNAVSFLLQKKKLPMESDAYIRAERIDQETNAISYLKEELQQKKKSRKKQKEVVDESEKKES